MRNVGTVVRGIRTPIIKENDNLEEIVIKSLGDYIKANKLISGATILGDGEVALILDVNTLM